MHTDLSNTGSLCKRHSALIVEKLFKNYGIKAVIMEKKIGEGAHYWVETEDRFIIDSFTIGHGGGLPNRAKALGNEDIIVIQRDTNNKLEKNTINEFYSSGVYQVMLTTAIWEGRVSIIGELGLIIQLASERAVKRDL